MKFLNEIRHQLVDRTIDGTTNQVSEPYTVRVPKLPETRIRSPCSASPASSWR